MHSKPFPDDAHGASTTASLTKGSHVTDDSEDATNTEDEVRAFDSEASSQPPEPSPATGLTAKTSDTAAATAEAKVPGLGSESLDNCAGAGKNVKRDHATDGECESGMGAKRRARPIPYKQTSAELLPVACKDITRQCAQLEDSVRACPCTDKPLLRTLLQQLDEQLHLVDTFQTVAYSLQSPRCILNWYITMKTKNYAAAAHVCAQLQVGKAIGPTVA